MADSVQSRSVVTERVSVRRIWRLWRGGFFEGVRAMEKRIIRGSAEGLERNKSIAENSTGCGAGNRSASKRVEASSTNGRSHGGDKNKIETQEAPGLDFRSGDGIQAHENVGRSNSPTGVHENLQGQPGSAGSFGRRMNKQERIVIMRCVACNWHLHSLNDDCECTRAAA